jgi:hypothetical protein
MLMEIFLSVREKKQWQTNKKETWKIVEEKSLI